MIGGGAAHNLMRQTAQMYCQTHFDDGPRRRGISDAMLAQIDWCIDWRVD
jgi:hypothetical protein